VELWEPAGAQVRIVDVEQAIRQACRRWRVLEIAADRFRWARSLQLLDGEGLLVLEYPQSPGRMTPATARFYEAVVNGQLTHSGDSRLARPRRQRRTPRGRPRRPPRQGAPGFTRLDRRRRSRRHGPRPGRRPGRRDPGQHLHLNAPRPRGVTTRGRRPDRATVRTVRSAGRRPPTHRVLGDHTPDTRPPTYEGTPTAGLALPPNRRTPPPPEGPRPRAFAPWT
jgi:hypothetical protein